ncbi:MAG: hypothetical protein WKF31_04210 [Thermoleophilaceae bacterium]
MRRSIEVRLATETRRQHRHRGGLETEAELAEVLVVVVALGAVAHGFVYRGAVHADAIVGDPDPGVRSLEGER